MLLAAALALTSVLPPIHLHPPQVIQHRYVTGGWVVTVGHDKFTGALTCALKTRGMHYRNETLIFHLKNGEETTHAFFRVDDGPARPVSDAFHEVETHGFFPRRGWVEDPAGGDVALPASYVRDAHRVWIRASTKSRPVVFKVNRFDDALDHAQAEGCTEDSFKIPS
jgi:hypothetical protein